MTEPDIKNPTRWFYAYSDKAEWWHQGGASWEECIAEAAQGDDPIWIVEARRMEPDFAVFDAVDLMEQLSDQESWGENGAEGVPCFERRSPEFCELETELAAVLRRWYIKHGGSLDGAQLDFVQGPHRVDPVGVP
ncbi:MAG: hypothetical protein AB7E55_36225 [Pigmentiphaga sp.]